MLAQRLRRWAKLKTSPLQRVVFAGIAVSTFSQQKRNDSPVITNYFTNFIYYIY